MRMRTLLLLIAGGEFSIETQWVQGCLLFLFSSAFCIRKLFLGKIGVSVRLDGLSQCLGHCVDSCARAVTLI